MQTIEAIFQNGVFKPLQPVPDEVKEGDRVQIELETRENASGKQNPIMKLAENFYEGLSEEDITEIERIALDRSEFFGGREP